jgi:hypothetical protein
LKNKGYSEDGFEIYLQEASNYFSTIIDWDPTPFLLLVRFKVGAEFPNKADV